MTPRVFVFPTVSQLSLRFSRAATKKNHFAQISFDWSPGSQGDNLTPH